MSLPVTTTPEADAQIRTIDDWWRENRPASPNLFFDELSAGYDPPPPSPFDPDGKKAGDFRKAMRGYEPGEVVGCADTFRLDVPEDISSGRHREKRRITGAGGTPRAGEASR